MTNPGVFGTPRPVPETRRGMIGGTVVIVGALPVFLIADWRLAGWALAAGLWVAYQAAGMVLQRLPLGMGNLGSAGVVAIGRMLRAVVLAGILIVVAVSDSSLGLRAALVYALAYTVELGLSVATYFEGEARR
jgi:hypothetical protein